MQSMTTENALEADWFGEDQPEAARDRAADSSVAMKVLVDGLEPPPQVVTRVLALASNPDTGIAELREAIEGDAALVVRLVRLANSSAMATRVRAASLDEAVLRLGTRRIRGITAGLAALGSFSREHAYASAVRAHSTRVAMLAETLGREWRQAGASDLFLAGLVHDVGELAILEADAMAPPDDPNADASTRHLEERETLGFDHAALGRVMLDAWKFPADVVSIVDLHHDAARAYQVGGDVGAAVAILRLAEDLDDAFQDEDIMPVDFDAIGHRGECSYLSISPAVLGGMETRLRAVLEDAASLLK
ncbi:MAG: HDOD domain-containing protein [Sandaracinaceae bacterium]